MLDQSDSKSDAAIREAMPASGSAQRGNAAGARDIATKETIAVAGTTVRYVFGIAVQLPMITACIVVRLYTTKIRE